MHSGSGIQPYTEFNRDINAYVDGDTSYKYFNKTIDLIIPS